MFAIAGVIPWRRAIAAMVVIGFCCLGRVSAADPNAPQPAAKKFTPEEQAQLDGAQELSNTVVALSAQRNFQQAVPFAEKIVEICKKVLGEQHSDYANSLDSLARLYDEQGNYARAEPLYKQALEIRKKVFGEQHADYANSLNNVGLVYQSQGDYARAEPLLKQALEVYKQALGEGHPDYATSLNNLARLYYAEEDYARAETLYLKALEIVKKFQGEQHRDYADSLTNLAELYQARGDYAQAEPLYLQALQVQKVREELRLDYAKTLNGLATLYYAEGDFARAEPRYQQALEIRKKILGERHPDYCRSLSNLALLYKAQKDYAQAEPLLKQALEIDQKVLGERHPDFAAGLNNLAALYVAQGKYTQAEPLLKQALEINKKSLGESHPQYAASLNNLAELHRRQGDYAQAVPLYQQALEINQKVLGALHPQYASTLNNLALAEMVLRNPEKAALHAIQAAEITRRHLELTAVIQSERQQLTMAESNRHYLDGILSVGRTAKAPGDAVYDQILAWKGAVASRQTFLRAMRRDLKEQPETLKIYTDLQDATRQLGTLINVIPKEPQRDAYKQRLVGLSDSIENLQQKLAQASTAFATQRQQQRRTAADLKELLPAGTALVDILEYWHYGYVNETDKQPVWQRRFTGFVLRKDKPIAWVDLGLAKDATDSVEKWRATYGQGPGAEQAASALRKQIWEPLQDALDGAETVLISPDGALSKFPFAALPGEKPGTYLLEERAIAVIPYPQMLPELLARSQAANRHPGPLPKGEGEKQSPASLLLVGNVDYGGEPGVMLASAETHRGERAVRDGKGVWPPLPGTRTEIVAIRDSFEQHFADGKVNQLREKDATEQAVREQASKNRYLHFATHGFFADPSVKSLLAPKDRPESELFRENMRAPIVGNHPGLLSGIVLTGANQPAADDRDDGILTALEVGELDLDGVELATLSACETGLGKTAGGEGLLGLQRAFQLAGAKTTVATVWKVRDDAARSLMIDMYENLWGKGMSKIEALRQAQLSMLKDGIKRGLESAEQPADAQKRLPPYYWAAFVLSGDWR